MAMPAGYMFKEVPDEADEGQDPVELTLAEMDNCGVEAGLVGGEHAERGRERASTRGGSCPAWRSTPTTSRGAVRKIRAAQGRARHQGGDDVPRRAASRRCR